MLFVSGYGDMYWIDVICGGRLCLKTFRSAWALGNQMSDESKHCHGWGYGKDLDLQTH